MRLIILVASFILVWFVGDILFIKYGAEVKNCGFLILLFLSFVSFVYLMYIASKLSQKQVITPDK